MRAREGERSLCAPQCSNLKGFAGTRNPTDTLALMIQEHGDYKSLDPTDILERLNTHEFQLAEKIDLVTPLMRLYLPRVEARLRGITALKAMAQVR